MGKLCNREHYERRVDRYYRLAAAAKIPEMRQFHIARARYYRRLLALIPTFGQSLATALGPQEPLVGRSPGFATR